MPETNAQNKLKTGDHMRLPPEKKSKIDALMQKAFTGKLVS